MNVSPYVSRAAASVRSLAEAREQERTKWLAAAKLWHQQADDYKIEGAKCADPSDRERLLLGANLARDKAIEIETKWGKR